MSYLIIPSAGGTCHRRVDFGAIADLFVEDEPIVAAPPSRFLRVTAAVHAFVAPLGETLGLLRDEALVRKLQTHEPHHGVRAYGI